MEHSWPLLSNKISSKNTSFVTSLLPSISTTTIEWNRMSKIDQKQICRDCECGYQKRNQMIVKFPNFPLPPSKTALIPVNETNTVQHLTG